MRNIYNAILVVLGGGIILSCGNFVGKIHSHKDADKRTQMEYRLEELGLVGNDGGVITNNVPAAGESSVEQEPLPMPSNQNYEAREEQFFSAQVFASKSSTEAREFKESISSLFEDDVRIEYQAPYYKVCVGRVQGYDNAQELLKKVNSMGFPKAWLVKLENHR